MVFTLIATLFAAPPHLERYSFDEPLMGTRFRILVYAPDEASANKAARAAFERARQLDAIMSDYKPASELRRLCDKAGGQPVKVSDELYFVLDKAQQLSRRSDGAFDVTVGPIVKVWRFARKAQRLPDADELKETLPLVGHAKMTLDPRERTVQLAKPKMLLDLGGIGKGYAADEMLKVLKDKGLPSALVAAGGDIAVGDPPPGEKGWKVAIAPLDPNAKRKRSLRLANAAVSTSGDAEQFVEIDGKRYSHIVDPKTGMGVLGPFSVTVTARRGIDSDSLTKAVLILGPDKGLKLIDDTPGTAALIVRTLDGKEHAIRSKGFKESD